MPKRRKTVLGPHPAPDGFGCYTNAQDGKTQSGVAHRSLSQDEGCQDETIKQIRPPHAGSDVVLQLTVMAGRLLGRERNAITCAATEG